MRKRAGFTLVELLVVIGIISVLAGLAIPIAAMVQRKALKAKARANLTALAVALEAYNTLAGAYPGASVPGLARDDPAVLFAALYTGNPRAGGSTESHVPDWPLESIGLWNGSFLQVYDSPAARDLDYSSGRGARCVFLDPWGHAYHYVEFDSRAAANRTVAGGAIAAMGAQRYAIWSDGPDGRNEWGAGDDVNGWSEGTGPAR